MFLPADKLAEIEEYSKEHSLFHDEEVEKFFEEVERITFSETELPQMLTGKLVGRFITILVYLLRPKLCIDVGTFTGYSAFSQAYGIYLSGSGGKVITIEKSKKHIDIFRRLKGKCPFPCDVEVWEGEALDLLRKIDDLSVDFIFVDADKENYPNYFQEAKRILRKGGILVFDNALWSGTVLNPSDTESRAIAKTNELVLKDQSFSKVLLPVRDGLLICLKVG